MTTFTGGCHCRNIGLELTWPDDALPARKCGCSFCVKHNASWTSHVDAELKLQVSEQSKLSRYAFGTKTAEFYTCSICGVPVAAVSMIDEVNYAVVNISVLENVNELEIVETKTNFDGEGVDDRLERRKRNWIGRVHILG